MEITQNPHFLYSPNFSPSEASFLGVKLGSRAADIPKDTKNNLYALGIRFESADGLVANFYLSNAFTQHFAVANFSELETKFGDSDDCNFHNGERALVYPHKKLKLFWNVKDNKLDRICFGESFTSTFQYTALTFIELFLEFAEMCPNPKEWNTNLDYEPSLYRFLQLQAYIKAFNLGNDLETDFYRANFLKTRSAEELAPTLEKVKQFAESSSVPTSFYGHKPSNTSIKWIFSHFMDFLKHTRAWLRCGSGWIEAGDIGVLFLLDKINTIQSSFDKSQLSEIHEFLDLLINPARKTFTRKQLIESYGFPDVDLRRIDWDNW
jgi:hypothetical protein